MRAFKIDAPAMGMPAQRARINNGEVPPLQQDPVGNDAVNLRA